MLKAEDLQVKIGREVIIDDINFELKRHEICTLLGPNGAGKTTLLRALAGILKPTRGNVTVDNIPVRKLHPDDRVRKVMHIPQEIGELPGLTVEEYLKLISNGEERVKDVAESLSLPLKKTLRELSGGMRRKAIFAIALVKDSDFWLLDEPFTFMDMESFEDLVEKVMEAKSKGRGIVVVTHDKKVAEEIGDRIVLMRDGRILS